MLLPLADKLSLNTYLFSKSSFVSFSNTCNLVGAALEKAMFLPGRKTHGIPNRLGKQPFFLF
jgi:hypothetical protein